MANKVLEYIIRALDKTGDGTKSAKEGTQRTTRSILGNLANIKAGWDMATGAIVSGAKAVWTAVKEAFHFESLTIQFSVLMGSLKKAKDRMKELSDFAAQTPFELNEIAQASRQLHVFSDGAMGATESLRLVGDAAAAVGQNLQEVSFWVGRAYAMIKGGQPFGEAAMRLQEMGIITPQVRSKMEELQAAGAANIDVWKVLSARLYEFKGGMGQLSQTGDGLVSTLKDTWTESVRTFGQAFMDVSKTAIGGLIEWMGRLNSDGTIKAWADKTLEVLYQVAGAAKAVYEGGAMRDTAWSGIKDVLIGGLEVGAQKAMSFMEASAPRIGALIGSAIKAVAESVISPFVASDRRATAIKSLGIDPLGEAKNNGLFYERKKRQLTNDEERMVKERIAEMIRMESLDAAGVSSGKPMLAGQDKLDRGLNALKSLGASFKADVDAKAKELKDAATAPAPAGSDAKRIAEEKRIADDMAKVQKINDEKRLVEAAQKEAVERKKLTEKLIDEEHKARINNIREEAQISAQSEANARDRLSRATNAAQQAWGWYRDPESFKRQLAEEKANSAAEKKYEKDFDKLNDRRDWRTTTRLTDSEESVRRVALAREEQTKAQLSLAAIEKNTAGLEAMLKRLLTSK